jgi:hypothetical protein
MHNRLNKTTICSVLCVDIVGHSRKPDADQIRQKEHFNELVEAALSTVSKNDRVILDTGDGAAIAFFGAPEDALTAALLIRDGVSDDNRLHPQHPFELRMGINLGPVRVVRDINDIFNIVGDGLNASQQVMSFAAPNRILVSRSYYEIVAPGNDDVLRLFSHFGIRKDNDAREYDMYIVGRAESESRAAWREVSGQLGKIHPNPAFWMRAATLGLMGFAALVLLLSHLFESPSAASPVEAGPPGLDPARAVKDAHAKHSSAERKADHAPFQCTEAARMLNKCN